MTSSAFQTQQYPVLIIGSGISGLFTALKLASYNIQVLLVTKSTLSENNSRYAQGGIAAVLPDNPEDSLELHVQDTLKAGAGLCNEDAARSILSDGYDAIADMLDYGVPFDKKPNTDLALTLEAGHSVRRILHAGGDATGREVEMTLVNKVRQHPLIAVKEFCQVTELLVDQNRCIGARACLHQEQQQYVFLAHHVVLATGGVGRLFAQTTNPSGATGDGFALAYRAGAALKDMEFVQFHPTAFYSEGNVQFLISEALRGEGGILRNAQGEAFAHKYHPNAELAPRDIVTRAIYSEIQAQSDLPSPLPHVYLDITHLPHDKIETRFPTILTNCLTHGVDIRKDWIPVSPAAHYIMGGVDVTPQGQSTIDGLFVVGETAHTGLHGANRLASNSLLECVVLARRVAEEISLLDSAQRDTSSQSHHEPVAYRYDALPEVSTRIHQLHQWMWQDVGIIRSSAGLLQALNQVEAMLAEVEDQGLNQVVPAGVELHTQLVGAHMIILAALAREESRGAHYRSDFPDTEVAPMHSIQEQHQPTVAAVAVGVNGGY
ncbi:MAG: L-aspartate oxidase [Vampirovibrio sp.]|nr:L-aspartate oxidase [Vampirovibrio sp.]